MNDRSSLARSRSRTSTQEDHGLVIIYQGKVILALDVAHWMDQGRAVVRWLKSTKAATSEQAQDQMAHP